MARLLSEIISNACINSGVASTFGTDDIPDDVVALATNILTTQVLRSISADPRLMHKELLWDYSERTSGVFHYDGDVACLPSDGPNDDMELVLDPKVSLYGVAAVIRNGETLTRVSLADFFTVYKDRSDVYTIDIATDGVFHGTALSSKDTVEVVRCHGTEVPTVVYNEPITVSGTGDSAVLICPPCMEQYITDLLAYRMAATYSVNTIDTCKAMADMSLNSCLKPYRKPMLNADPIKAMGKIMSFGRSLE